MNTLLLIINLYKTAKAETMWHENGIIFSLRNQTYLKQTFTVSWSKNVTVYTLSTGARQQHIKRNIFQYTVI